MVARLTRLYESWEDNPDIDFVLIKGNGKTFCSGADIVYLTKLADERGTLHSISSKFLFGLRENLFLSFVSYFRLFVSSAFDDLSLVVSQFSLPLLLKIKIFAL